MIRRGFHDLQFYTYSQPFICPAVPSEESQAEDMFLGASSQGEQDPLTGNPRMTEASRVKLGLHCVSTFSTHRSLES